MQQNFDLLLWVKSFAQNQNIEMQLLTKIVWFSCLSILVDLASQFLGVFRKYIVDKEIFKQMIDRILYAPVNLFFDVTPSGKIITRITNDLDMVSVLSMLLY